MKDTNSSYRQIIKSTSVFGSVQLFTIIIALVRSKFVALFVGPNGIGLIGLLTSVLNLVGSFTNAGLETSGVKAISTAEGNPELLTREVSVLKRLIWITGILGAVSVAVLSPLLSKMTFGDDDFTVAFLLISVTLLFKQLTNGSLIILQGLSKIQYLAKANLYGNLLGLLVSLPLYYFFKIDGIVPSIVLSSLVALFAALYFRLKIKIHSTRLSDKQVFQEGKQLIMLGFSLSLIGLLTTLSSYLLQVFITHSKGITEVGFYNAGFMILNTYVGIVFTAMATDYYPRLAKICHDNFLVKKMVTEQATIAVLLLTPIVVVFLAFAPIIVNVLYSEAFLAIVPLVCWGILGMVIKAVSWSMGYILIARGDSRVFVKTSIFFNSVFLISNIAGFHFYGLQGLGITFLINYIIHFLGLKLITAKKYGFGFDSEFYKLFLNCILICGIAFLGLSIESIVLKYALLSILILFSFWFSFTQLNKRIDFKDFFTKGK